LKQKNNSAISITGYITKTKLKEHHGNIKQDQYYTGSNFSDIFILWDKIFGTYKYKPVERIKFGLKEFEEEKNKLSGTR